MHLVDDWFEERDLISHLPWRNPRNMHAQADGIRTGSGNDVCHSTSDRGRVIPTDELILAPVSLGCRRGVAPVHVELSLLPLAGRLPHPGAPDHHDRARPSGVSERIRQLPAPLRAFVDFIKKSARGIGLTHGRNVDEAA